MIIDPYEAFLKEAQFNFGGSPFTQPERFIGENREPTYPWTGRDPYANNFYRTPDRPKSDEDFADFDLLDFDGGDEGSETPDTGDMEPTLGNIMNSLSWGLGMATPYGWADVAIGKAIDDPKKSKSLLGFLKTVYDTITEDPYDYDPFDTSLPEFGPEAYSGGFASDQYNSISNDVGLGEGDFGGGVGPGGNSDNSDTGATGSNAGGGPGGEEDGQSDDYD